ncbi:hypothetical protein CEY16_01870 [Halalkalibacillus sediminis]|uniref:DUF3397 domain-containing protein n=1 Tax=Halalkalibacillus sediminis TaxID=2018042 RepID=A0A2I0QW30_9BACI|nr:DUF3397 domain-containing protein [Halalkalibacillus sediminis]PKR78528.1 hypothetical protein CEY16_01870 [Halalkalibacillus sediminis]
MSIITTIIAILATIPYLSFIIIFILLKRFTGQSTYSTKLAADLSSILFIIAVNALLFMIFDQSFLVWTLVFYLVLLGIIITFQRTRDIHIDIWKACRQVWRGGFIFWALSYLILLPVSFYFNLS